MSETKKLIATILFILLAGGSYYGSKEFWFDDYEVVHKVYRDQLRSPELSQDIVVIALDFDSYLANPKFPWPRSDQAKIINRLNQAGVDRIFLNFYFPQASNDADDFAFMEALKNSNAKIYTTHLASNGAAANATEPLYEPFRPYATPLSSGFYSTEMGHTIATFYRDDDPNSNQRGMASEIANVDGGRDEYFLVDYAYDWKKIPTISAIDILIGKADLADLNGKTVVYGYYAPNFGGTYNHPGGDLMPGTARIVLSANLLLDGKPYVVDPLIPILVAVSFILAVLWFLHSRAAGILSLFGIPMFFAVATLLESQLIYPQVLTTYALFIASAAYHRTAIYIDRVDEVQRMDQEKSRFLARASHDLRQPIHAIGMLNAQLGQTELTPAQADFVSKIERSVESASSLFQSLLDLSVVESGGLKPNFQSIPLAELFADIKKQHGILAESTGIDLRIVSSDKAIEADPILLTAMLQNILSNAMKYAPDGEILIGCRQKKDSLSIWVCDRGQGIDEEDLKQITNEFFRSSGQSDQSIQGSGLGLAIVKRLAEAMNVEVKIDSVLGQGTTVTIGDFTTTEAPTPVILQAENIKPMPLSGMRVAFLDDDSETLHATQSMLEQWGCEVDAKQRFPNRLDDIDILISDYDFGNGLTLADHRDRILELKRQNVPTIIVSGHQKEAVYKAMEITDLMVLSKPLKPSELRSLLMSCKVNTSQGTNSG